MTKVDSEIGKVDSGTNTMNQQFIIYESLLKEKNISNKSISNIQLLYSNFEKNMFARSDVAKILGCSNANASKLINIMKKGEIIESVSGHGQGKYRFLQLE